MLHQGLAAQIGQSLRPTRHPPGAAASQNDTERKNQALQPATIMHRT